MHKALGAGAAILLGIVAGRPALAQVTPGADCGALKTQTEMSECYARIEKAAENDLANTYRKLEAKLNDPAKKALLEAAQKAWRDYRERECALETADSGGGSIHPMELSICLAEKTGARVEELARQLNCPEGDLSCVH